jgi:catalase
MTINVELLMREPDAVQFVNEAYKHYKAIAADSAGKVSAVRAKLQGKGKTGDVITEDGVLIDCNPDEFIRAIAQHRFWEREKPGKVPA